MEQAQPTGGADWNLRARGETDTQQLDRNLAALFQELRVVQTGVQLLTGFLLTLPFQARFDAVSTPMRGLYLAVVSSSIAATVFLVAPVAAHRILFRRHRLATVVRIAHTFALIGLALLGFALTGVAVLIFVTVAGAVAATVVGCCSAVLFLGVWLVLPWRERRRSGRP